MTAKAIALAVFLCQTFLKNKILEVFQRYVVINNYYNRHEELYPFIVSFGFGQFLRA